MKRSTTTTKRAPLFELGPKPTELPEDDLLLYEATSPHGCFLILRPQKAPRTGISELDEQQEVVYMLRLRDEVVMSVPNDEERDTAAAAKSKRAGLLKGASDLVWVRGSGHTAYIEMKRSGESMEAIRPEQVTFLGKCARRGHLAVVCFGFRAARYLINNVEAFTTYCKQLNEGAQGG
jgi:hypothetical protein